MMTHLGWGLMEAEWRELEEEWPLTMTKMTSMAHSRWRVMRMMEKQMLIVNQLRQLETANQLMAPQLRHGHRHLDHWRLRQPQDSPHRNHNRRSRLTLLNKQKQEHAANEA